MAQYGYKLSGFARSEKFFEAEHYLDRRLKGFTKENASFAEDGSRTQTWKMTSDEGEKTVTLVKNITESGVIVFSDVELKELKHSGLLCFLRDVLWQAAFAALYWIGFMWFQRTPAYGFMMANVGVWGAVLGIGVLYAVIIALTYRPVSVRRIPSRTRFIQAGGVFTVAMILYKLWSWTFKGGGLDIRGFGMSLLYSQLAPLLCGWLIVFIIHKTIDRMSRK
ncbi:MAG: hypothetical protein IJ251_06200 [Oscillospiraceae bacterium]|nr:hypothetical protein [Oscillospiraceae bacterium]